VLFLNLGKYSKVQKFRDIRGKREVYLKARTWQIGQKNASSNLFGLATGAVASLCILS
jgi:hypothetical protein